MAPAGANVALRLGGESDAESWASDCDAASSMRRLSCSSAFVAALFTPAPPPLALLLLYSAAPAPARGAKEGASAAAAAEGAGAGVEMTERGGLVVVVE